MNELPAQPTYAQQRKRLRRAVNRLVKAEINDTWKGGGDPADKPAIEEELRRARKHYNEVLNSICMCPRS